MQNEAFGDCAYSLVGARHPSLKVLLHGTVLSIAQNKASSDFAFSLGSEFGTRGWRCSVARLGLFIAQNNILRLCKFAGFWSSASMIEVLLHGIVLSSSQNSRFCMEFGIHDLKVFCCAEQYHSLRRTKYLAALHTHWVWSLASMIGGVLLHGIGFIACSLGWSSASMIEGVL